MLAVKLYIIGHLDLQVSRAGGVGTLSTQLIVTHRQQAATQNVASSPSVLPSDPCPRCVPPAATILAFLQLKIYHCITPFLFGISIKATLTVRPSCSDKAHLVWYALMLCTSDMPAAGTDADVFVTLHGQQGTSPRIKLPSRPEDFLHGGEDTFRMELQALGDIVKLTVGHNNRGHNPGWHLDHAKLLDEETGRACL